MQSPPLRSKFITSLPRSARNLIRRSAGLWPPSLVIAGLAAGALVWRVSPAAACDPAPARGPTFPALGATDVPLDTLVFLGGRVSPQTLTVASTGAVIPVDEVTFPGVVSVVTAVRPKAPLPPNEEIIVGTGRSFRTGTTPSRAGGTWQVVNARKEVIPGGCGDSCGDDINLHLQLQTTVSQPETVFMIARAPRTGEVAPVVTAVITVPGAGNAMRSVVLPDHAGDGLLQLTPLDSAGRPDTAMPLAASFSEDKGCAIAGGGAGTSLLPPALLLLFTLGLRSRRRWSTITTGERH